MYVKTPNTGTRLLTIRAIDGDYLESPITVEFSDSGVAKVSDGVGEYLANTYEAIEILEVEEEEEY